MAGKIRRRMDQDLMSGKGVYHLNGWLEFRAGQGGSGSWARSSPEGQVQYDGG